MELKNILCPLDGTELTDKVEDAAQYLAKISNARIILLYVVEKWYRSEGLVTNSRSGLSCTRNGSMKAERSSRALPDG